MKKNIFKDITSLGIIQIANYILPLLSMPIITRIIGPENFGLINYSATYITYFNLLIGYGFDISATRSLLNKPNDLAFRIKTFNEVFFTKLLLFLVSNIFFIVSLYNIPILAQDKRVAIFSYIFCFSGVLTHNWIFQAMRDMPKIALLNFISKLLFTVLVIIIIDRKENYYLQPLVTSIVQIAIAAYSFYLAINKYDLKIKIPNIKTVTQLLIKERVVFFSLIIVSLYTTTNTVILGTMTNIKQVGIYIAGQKLIAVTYSIVNIPLGQALFPVIGRALEESKEKGVHTIQKIVPIIVILTGVVGIVLLIVGPQIMIIFYGEQFKPSIIVFQLLAFIPLIVALNNTLGVQIMLNLKMDIIYFKLTLFGAIFSIIMNLVLIKSLGYIGSALAWIITEVFILFSTYFILRRHNINPIKWKRFLPNRIWSSLMPILPKLGK